MKRAIFAALLTALCAGAACAEEAPKNYLAQSYGQMLGECLQSRGADMAKAASLADENAKLKAQIDELTKKSKP